MIKGVFWLYFLLVSVFLIVVVSADDQCDPEQIILKLYSDSNSHVGLWNTENFQINVCYEDIFGGRYEGNDPHSCSVANGDGPANFVVGLTDDENAHSGKYRVVGGSGVNVCYGDLVCSVKTQCSGIEKEVIQLSSESNAHAGVAGSSSNYGLKVCCSSISEPANLVYWANGLGRKITSSNKGRTVWLIAKAGLPQNTEVKFEIKEKDAIFDDDILIGDEALRANTDVNGQARISWSITQDVIDRAKSKTNDEDKNQDEVEFYFEASSASGFSKKSEILNVNINPLVSPPIARISKPEHRQIYFKDKEIVFESGSTDSDGEIVSSEWIIEEEPNAQVGDEYTFTSPGQKTITLKVTDDSGQSSEAQIAILIIDKTSNGLLAFIEKPRHKEIVQDSNRRGVEFGAEESYVIKNEVRNDCSGDINCIAGDCPVQTKNECLSNNPLSKKDVIGGKKGFDSMNFIWEFDDGYSFQGSGNPAVKGTKPYSSFSQERDDKWIKLTASIDNPFLLSKETRRIFTLVGRDQCLLNEDGGVFVKFDDNGFIEEKRKINEGGCVGTDGVAGGRSEQAPLNVRGDDCCPAGTFCRAGLGTNRIGAGCSNPEFTDVRSCGDYLANSECEDDPFDVGESESNPERTEDPACGKRENGGEWICNGCVWREDKCVLEKTHKKLPSITLNRGCEESKCYVSSKTSELTCESDGYFTINVEKRFMRGTCSPLPEDSCVSNEARVPCRGNLQLPFFGLFNMLATLVVIAFIYRIKKSLI